MVVPLVLDCVLAAQPAIAGTETSKATFHVSAPVVRFIQIGPIFATVGRGPQVATFRRSMFTATCADFHVKFRTVGLVRLTTLLGCTAGRPTADTRARVNAKKVNWLRRSDQVEGESVCHIKVAVAKAREGEAT